MRRTLTTGACLGIVTIVLTAGVVAEADGPVWPLVGQEPSQRRVGNTYGEFQRSGPTPYLHPGLDLMGTPGSVVVAICSGTIESIGKAPEDPARFVQLPDGSYRVEILLPPKEAEAVFVRDLGGTEVWTYGHIQALRTLQYLGHLSWPQDAVNLPVAVGAPLSALYSWSDSTHLHVERGTAGATLWVIANPWDILASFLPPDDVAPVVGQIVFDADETAREQGMTSPFPRVWVGPSGQDSASVLFGEADIIAHAHDCYYSSNALGSAGIYSIGYEIRESGTTVLGPECRTFSGSMYAPINIVLETAQLTTRTIYRDTLTLVSPMDDALYVASNYHTDLGEANWTAEARKACWNTRMEQGGGLPWEAADASYPEEAEISDGVYTVTVTASDYSNETSISVPVIVDNWAPWLKEVMVWKDSEEGKPDVPDSTDWTILT